MLNCGEDSGLTNNVTIPIYFTLLGEWCDTVFCCEAPEKFHGLRNFTRLSIGVVVSRWRRNFLEFQINPADVRDHLTFRQIKSCTSEIPSHLQATLAQMLVQKLLNPRRRIQMTLLTRFFIKSTYCGSEWFWNVRSLWILWPFISHHHLALLPTVFWQLYLYNSPNEKHYSLTERLAQLLLK